MLFNDLRIGFRVLLRSPRFSLLAVFCLTLGIGATASVFSWIEGILLRPFPKVARQERMFAMTGTDRNGRTDVSLAGLPGVAKRLHAGGGFRG